MSNTPEYQISNAVPPVNSGLKRFRGKWTSDEARHLLKRTLFGAKPAEVQLFASKSPEQCLDILLNTVEEAPAPPVNNYNDDVFTDPDVPLAATWVNDTTKNDGMKSGRRRNSFKSWWIGVMLQQQTTLQEKMVVFWHNHFATEARTVDHPILIYRHHAMLRRYALGNFKELVKEVTKDMAMLRYLNGAASTKKAPDENYGRELQELFTVGKGPGSHYTEDDVKAAARVLTGYYVDYNKLTSVFGAGRHDETDKQFSAFYGNTVIKGRKGAEGEQELDDLLNMIFAKEEVSRFICRRLYRYFVYYKIDEETERNIIEPLAKTFRKSNYEIKPVLRELLGSRHFFDPANRGGMIKSPLDFVVGLCREYDVQFSPDMGVTDLYGMYLQVQQWASNMQQNIGDPPNVSGWPAWYQEPQYDKVWVNSDTLPRRSQFTDKMITGGITRYQNKAVVDPLSFAKHVSDPSNPDTLISESVRMLYMVNLTPKDIEFLKTSVLLSGLQGKMSDHYWTQAWQNLMTKPDDKANRNNVYNKLKSLYKYLMNLPQYQLC